MPFKLRQTIFSHDNDVRAVCVLPDGSGFLSASRDYSVRLWTEEKNEFVMKKKYPFHEKYICFVNIFVSNDYPSGLVLSGGYDKNISCYTLLSDTVDFLLTGHTDAVTSVAVTKSGVVISASMDSTAIVWDLSKQAPWKILKGGHSYGIWSVLVPSGVPNGVLTASVDKTIALWDLASATVTRRFEGHQDCVRSLAQLPDAGHFLSCGNDGTVIRWRLVDGANVGEHRGHGRSFLYSAAALPGLSNRFVSVGEDGLLCVWQAGHKEPLQSLKLPVQSLWSVAVLSSSGDLVVGGSDGCVRVFSEDPQRQNGIELQPVADGSALQDTEHLEPVGIQALSLPGHKDGELMKVDDEGSCIIYRWSQISELWVAQGAPTSQPANKEITFSIDIKDGEPPLKLCFTPGQDPNTVAYKFLSDNDLSMGYLDQVVQFILTNTNSDTSTQAASAASGPGSSYVDPFTGTNRYVPAPAQLRSFPVYGYVSFDTINAEGLQRKVIELAGHSIPTEISTNFSKIVSLQPRESEDLLSWILDSLLKWNSENLYPLIDTLRMLALDETCNSVCFETPQLLQQVLERVLPKEGDLSRANILTTVKLLVNCFCHQTGRLLMRSISLMVAVTLQDIVGRLRDPNVLFTVSSWMLNAAILLEDEKTAVSASNKAENNDRSMLAKVCVDMAGQVLIEPPSKHRSLTMQRLLVTMGTLLCRTDGKFDIRGCLTATVCMECGNLAREVLQQQRAVPEQWDESVRQAARDLLDLVDTIGNP